MLAFLKANYLTILIILVLVAIVVGSHVNDTVRRNFHVKSVKASHKKKQAEIISAEPLDEAALRKAIGDTGYTVTDVHTEPYKKKGLFGH